jgi:hypothetical protein
MQALRILSLGEIYVSSSLTGREWSAGEDAAENAVSQHISTAARAVRALSEKPTRE